MIPGHVPRSDRNLSILTVGAIPPRSHGSRKNERFASNSIAGAWP